MDLCTGSGAIAASIAYEVPGARVHAVELDPPAFQWAERNLAGSGVDLRLGDMADAFPDLDGTVDVVVCNPPYIPLEAFESVAPEARDHDPALALWSGEDGLDAIRVLEATRRSAAQARWLGRRRARRRPGGVRQTGLPRRRPLDRRTRPRGPGRSIALRGGPAGTMTP